MPGTDATRSLPVQLDSRLQQKAEALDAKDDLRIARAHFNLPPQTYLCGNSLGAQPKRTSQAVTKHLQKWGHMAVAGHFTNPAPWAMIEEEASNLSMAIVGAKFAHEVCVMNSLTVNLHLLLTAFYQPTARRCKILLEDHAFSSDEYALASHVRARGLDPKQVLVRVCPREGESILRVDDIEADIRTLHGRGELALVFLPGVQYCTGQVFPLERLARVCQSLGVSFGSDLAHAVGNIPLQLHEWGLDFGIWCNYKYLNSGPGAIAGAFLHDRHADADLERLAGWWGHKRETRFGMPRSFDAQRGVRGFQLSNPPVLAVVPVTESLKVFEKFGGVHALRKKSLALTGFLYECVCEVLGPVVEIITPREEESRGCQLSIRLRSVGAGAAAGAGMSVQEVNEELSRFGVVCDVREPDIIRVAPTPLYNCFVDVVVFVCALKQVMNVV